MKKLVNKAITVLAIGLATMCAEASDKNIFLDETNSVLFKGEVDTLTCSKVQDRLQELANKRGLQEYPIYLVLDTPGGSIDDGLNFIEFAKPIKNLHTITFFAASMGSAIVQGLPGKRYIIETGSLMFHRARGGFQGQFETGEAENRLQAAKDLVLYMEKTNANRMSMPIKDYKEKVLNEWYIFGFNSLKNKAADEVISVSCSDDLIKRKETIHLATFFGFFDLSYSSCPLFRNIEVSEEQKEQYSEYLKSKQNSNLK